MRAGAEELPQVQTEDRSEEWAAAAKVAPLGSTCSTAIPLGDNYSAQITGQKSVWYTAGTFDLPLSVYFMPQNDTDPKPDVEMDFSCTSGIYEDDILCSLFCKNSGSGIQLDMPHKPALKETIIEGRKVYYLAIGKEYRDLLLKTGIDYNVDVYVKVTYKSAGTISIAPDDMFTNCMDDAKFMHLGDTIHVKPLDKERHVIVPYVQWQDDSIRYVWLSEEPNVPCTLAIANVCEFDPTSYTDGNIIDRNFDGKDTLKVTSKLLHDYVSDPKYPNEAGMYFVKCYSQSAGVLKIERVPMAPPRGGATLLRYDKATPIAANDNKLYAIPYTWETATLFTSPTDHIFRMKIGIDPDFETYPPFATYQFHRTDTSHWYGLQNAEMQALWTHTSEKYLYVRFECTAKTTLTPSRWTVPECFGKANDKELSWPKAVEVIQKNTYGSVYYRFYYDTWKDGDIKFSWSGSTTCPTYIGDNCSFGTSSSDQHRIIAKTIARNGSWTIPAEDIADWSEYIDENGYLYVMFKPSDKGTMTITSTAPEEQDPAPIVYPAATVSVQCDGEATGEGQKYTVRVSKDQSLALYSGEISNILSRTPIEQWSQTKAETHTLTLPAGIYTLKGDEETIQIEAATGSSPATTPAIALGTNVSSATNIEKKEAALVTEGEENYFKILAEHLPATVYYLPDTAYGPIPALIKVVGQDTLQAVQVVDNCRMGWRWELPEAGEEEKARYLYFSSHENAKAEIQPYVCLTTYGEETIEECDSAQWNGEWFYASGTHTHTFVGGNAAGCDSIVTLHLTINHSAKGDTTATACGSFTWYGEEYTESSSETNVYTHKLTTKAGCDSIVTLHLTINQPYDIVIPEEIKACDHYVWKGKGETKDSTIYQSGTYTRRFKSDAGCDSIVTQTINIGLDTYADDVVTAYESYTWIDGNTYTKSISGGPTWTLTNATGCDSVISLRLQIRHMHKDTLRVTICESECPYKWRGKEYSSFVNVTTDTIWDTRKAMLEYTDTLHTLELTVNPSYAVDTTATRKCEAFVWHGVPYTSSGDYPYEAKTALGCDSIVTLHLTIDWTTQGDTTAEACDTFRWYEHECTESRNYTHTFAGANRFGHDSIVTLHLTLKQSTKRELTETAYDSYIAPWGEELKASDTYVYTTSNTAGCDSTVTLYLTIHTTSYDTIREEGCERIEIDGKTYTETCTFNLIFSGGEDL